MVDTSLWSLLRGHALHCLSLLRQGSSNLLSPRTSAVSVMSRLRTVRKTSLSRFVKRVVNHLLIHILIMLAFLP